MRVLMLGWEFPPYNSGGLGVACEGLARALCEQDVEVIFVLPKKLDLSDKDIRFVFANIGIAKVRSVDTALRPYVTAKEYELRRRFLKSDAYGESLFGEVIRYAQAITKVVEEEQFDVIHAHDWLSFLAGVAAKEASGKPLILHVHITSFHQSGGPNVDGRVYHIERAAFGEADAIIAVSNYVKDTLIERYGVPDNKIHVVYNGITPEEYPSSIPNKGEEEILKLKRRGQKLVLYVGRLTLHKGPDYFIRAACKVLEHRPNTVFVVAGSGDMEWQLMRLAADLGIADKIFFTGFAKRMDVNALYQAADLFVLPSVSEPFGITPLESLINGTPVLISKQSGVSEVLHNALKVDFWDVDEMANKIVAVLSDKPLSEQLRQYGRGEVLRLTWKKAAERCAALYNKITSTFQHVNV